jgi:NAD(P)-dependent dehydrogenase (short-subunit alcohol dehydrogenase family)
MTFDDRSTTDEVLDGIDLGGTVALVTGASTGLGEETTRALAAHGAQVTMAVRDRERGDAAAERIRAAVPEAELDVMVLDLASLADIRRFAAEYLAGHDRLDLLVNNAGVMACPQATTVDGFELQIGTNHVGHFLLTQLLLPLLREGSRVVALSSAGHRFSDVDLDDPNFERTDYDPWAAYGRAKTANALFAVELDRRLRDRGAHAYSVHPGGIVTELGRHLTAETLAVITDVPSDQQIEWKTVPQGAATTVYAATAVELDAHGGAYLEDCGVAMSNPDPDSRGGIKPYAVDPARAAALWDRTEEWIATAERSRT